MTDEMNAIATFSIKPEFVYVLSAIKRDADGNEISRRESAESPNVFTNYGVEALFGATTGDSLGTIAGVVGTGNATPAITNTLLQSFLAGRYTSGGKGASLWVDNGDGTGYFQSSWVTIFEAGGATGNISEVGSAFRQTNPTNTTPLASRALVLDGGGNPTTFEVLADEELQLTQFFRRHVNYTDQTIVLTENGNNHTVTWRPWGVDSTGNWSAFPAAWSTQPSNLWVGYATGGSPVAALVPITSSSILSQTGGTGMGQSNTAQGAQAGTNAYVPGSKKRQCWSRYPTGSSLLITWSAMGQGGIGFWQFTISPPVNKSNLHRFTFTIELQVDNTP
jgi:hypothetical protein